MFDWISSGAFQISVLVLIVCAVVGGIGVTAFRQRVAAVPAAGGVLKPPIGAVNDAAVMSAKPAVPEALALLEFEEDPRIVSVARPRVVIGRHSDDDIRIRDVTVSRHHALLELDANGNFAIHNQTAGREEPNQLLVNGVYREHSVLADGDLITLGGVTFRFRRSMRQVA
jgi:pSer/pThr/pTyr-binding forkhead associated (FHA) protein